MDRRTFLRAAAALPALSFSRPAFAAASAAAGASTPRLALGYDNYAVRAMGWKASALLDHAVALKVDSLLISDLDAFESLEEAALRELRRRADDAGVALYVGSWSICPTSTVFRPTWGTAEEHVRLGLRVAQALGSPVFRVVLGTMQDRKTEGGIQARIADTVKVLRACRSEALDRGVRLAMENHAGDLHSWELLDLIDRAGRDFVGANIDTGNAAWTLEDPMDVVERLGPVAACSSLRDVVAWETPEGAAVQWTAAGEGLIDWKRLAERWAVLCPQVPIHIETISGAQRAFPYKDPAFWEHYDRRPDALARFEAFARRGRPLEAFRPPPGDAGRPVAQAQQKEELARSIAYLRDRIGLGRKAG
jgi:sugar phosphate isomerase/epimerase